jgi:TonB family protein
MKTPKESILQVAVIMALATSFALTTSCKNSGNTDSSTDTVATNTMNTMKADTAIAPQPKKTQGTAMVNEPVPVPTDKIVEDKDHVYNHAEVAPAFPGGQSALDDYVKDNIKYPGNALDHGIEGKVMVHFIVDEHGNITNVTTLGEPIGYGLEEEAMKVISASPKWTPGKVKGKDVKAYVLLPINFTLR